MKSGYRKFAMAMYFGTAVFVLCWFNRVTGQQCIEAIGVLAALYKVSNVVDKRLGGAG